VFLGDSLYPFMDTTPRKVLVLEDEAERITAFQRHFEMVHKHRHDVDLHIAKNYREFVEKMQKHSPFDLVMLDHDLGDYNAMCKHDGDPLNPPEFTGVHAARYITEMPLHLRPKATRIHSWNVHGALTMQTILQQSFISAAVEPFNRLRLPNSIP
jgi:CheY-like chemotaxis protein